MSTGPFARSTDLKRLRDEGYTVEILGSYLVLRDVPYATPEGQVVYGVLAAPVTFAGGDVSGMNDHTVHFQGQTPSDASGKPLSHLINSLVQQEIYPGLTVNFYFSQKPRTGAYRDNYAKFTTYVRLLGVHASDIDTTATAKQYRPVVADDDPSPFLYRDSASSRAGVDSDNEVFRGHRVAIVGVGGTGSYILDLVAKTPVDEIHLFDADEFVNHNAFRAPGASPLEVLETRPKKVDYFAGEYSRMRTGIVPHPVHVTAETVGQLAGMTWVFLAADEPAAKREIIDYLEVHDIPFIDVGMGIEKHDAGLSGTLRVTTSLPGSRDNARTAIPSGHAAPGGEYASNIQIADLNLLNAGLAVVRWKRALRFYADHGREWNATYSLFTNSIVNEGPDAENEGSE
ncbi:ThiF family adenylyltransferase [Occultella gossypii]|uniref:ThiF family adenylyltransferase n=1 Tax=Occultella gossypii TaxID=2800820 RepID=A0ABS7SDN1_9MICO|nr:ThiF family adenylyltransferase [Occultella gossypii]MBZ2198464.1 ThiF family adenylyltransferase [Occultella gossypii]